MLKKLVTKWNQLTIQLSHVEANGVSGISTLLPSPELRYAVREFAEGIHMGTDVMSLYESSPLMRYYATKHLFSTYKQIIQTEGLDTFMSMGSFELRNRLLS